MNLTKLFEDCAYNIDYDVIGNDVNYKFIEENDTLNIFFQGSNDIKADKGWIDWLRNFWFFPTRKKPYKGMKDPFYVHSGFLAAWKEVEDLVIGKITELDDEEKYKWKHINIIGYSHGAALACICHECVWYYRPDLNDNLQTYAFEAPRAFTHINKKVCERWKTCTIFRNNNDIVTHCPPKLFGFKHVGKVIQLHGSVDMIENKLWRCIKSHYPQSVADGLNQYEK